MIEVGDEVDYYPHEIHAREIGRHGEFGWVHGMRRTRQVGPSTKEEYVDEMTHSETFDKLKSPNWREAVRMRPGAPWHGIVKEIFDDGTVKVDIDGQPGVTLHYRVPIVGVCGIAHTCKKREA